MKAIVGRTYTLIASPSMFKDWIGHEFVVKAISKEEVNLVEAEDNFLGVAYISVTQEEFPQYFEETKRKPVEKVKPKKITKAGKWSDWHTIKLYGITYAYKENGKCVIVRSGGHRGVSKCHSEDKFDLEYGLRLAISRLVKNKANAEKKQKKTYEDLKSQWDKILDW